MAGAFLTDDITAILDTEGFAIQVDSYSAGGTPTVIFDDEEVEVDTGEGVTQIVDQPIVTGKSSDFTSIARDQLLTIAGVVFVIKSWKDDGTGIIEILLNRKQPV